MPAVRKMLFGVEAHVGADGLVRNLPGWSFMDWVPEWNFGIAPGGGFNGGGSSVENLLYLLALRSAAFVEESLGETEMAARWRRRAEALAQRINATYWCEARGMVADTAAKDRFSEHAQCLAILADALPPDRAKRAFDGLVSSDDLARCTVYFSHYLFETYFRFGRGDLFLKRLDLWRDFAKQDLKTQDAPGGAGRRAERLPRLGRTSALSLQNGPRRDSSDLRRLQIGGDCALPGRPQADRGVRAHAERPLVR